MILFANQRSRSIRKVILFYNGYPVHSVRQAIRTLHHEIHICVSKPVAGQVEVSESLVVREEIFQFLIGGMETVVTEVCSRHGDVELRKYDNQKTAAPWILESRRLL